MKFADKVYQTIRNIPKGKVSTYKLVAEAIGTKSYRAVGQALKRNPYAPEVPCHRVVASKGKVGGFMGKVDGESIQKKIKLLKSEGVDILGSQVLDFEEKLYRFSPEV